MFGAFLGLLRDGKDRSLFPSPLLLSPSFHPLNPRDSRILSRYIRVRSRSRSIKTSPSLTMSSTPEFTCFKKLPPELRFRIWKMALSEPCVCQAFGDIEAFGLRPALSMKRIGSEPHNAALSCREAWYIMRKSYGRLSCSATGGGFSIDFNNTVVYLGDDLNIMTVAHGFNDFEISRLKHVALTWTHYSALIRACAQLAYSFSNLQTVIFQHRRPPTSSLELAGHDLSLKRAERIASLLTYTGPEIGEGRVDTDLVRTQMLKKFRSWTPRIHLLAPDPEDAPWRGY